MLNEIIVMSYMGQRVTLMKCTWIPVHTQGNVVTKRQDEHGFWVMNHGRHVNANLKHYVIPAVVSQVWFNHGHNACKKYCKTSSGQEIS
jgi:hypothetical protein